MNNQWWSIHNKQNWIRDCWKWIYIYQKEFTDLWYGEEKR